MRHHCRAFRPGFGRKCLELNCALVTVADCVICFIPLQFRQQQFGMLLQLRSKREKTFNADESVCRRAEFECIHTEHGEWV